MGRVDNRPMPLPASLHTTHPASEPLLLWDVFCSVIDNFGDLGVCWRLCADLAARGHSVRLWVDDASPLQWMAPGAVDGIWPGIQVRGWEQSKDATQLANLRPADVWIEGFGCEIAPEFIAHHAHSTRASGQFPARHPVWINLEYLSAESFVERAHGLPSPVMSGPAKGWTKHFFYPGFTAHTGGLLREPDLLQRQQVFAQPERRAAWLAQLGIAAAAGETRVSLFCYEPAALPALLAQLDALPTPTRLLVTAGRASAAVQKATANGPALQQLRISYLPTLTQGDFDHLLWACDLNCVRGEDSVVRALWAGKPLVWQIYPQEDAAHVPKLDAFLDMLDASPSLRAFHHAWNATQAPTDSAALPVIDLPSWSQTVQRARERLLQMDDLTTQLLQFTLKKR
jgi:uncharacterized repeat protein (TIGR03837 family)